MNWKTWIPLVAAVGLALVAAKLTHNVIAGKKAGAKEAQGNFVQVVVARGDLQPGAVLTKENLTLAPMPGTTPPPHTYTSTDDLVDRVSTSPLVQGQPINERLLAPKGSGTGLQALVPAGMRAVTIEVNEFTGNAGLMAPGMTCDVVGTFRDDTTHDTISRTVVQNLKILAVGPRMTAATSDDDKQPYKSITLLASPKEAERVELATYTGRPRLSLRGGRDMIAYNSKGEKLSDFINGEAATASNWLKEVMRRQPTTRQSNDTNVEKVSETKVKAIDPFEQFEAQRSQQRTVKIIRNGVESSVIFEAPRTSRSRDIMTDTPNKEVFDTGANK